MRWLYPDFYWSVPVEEKVLFLTFDDGPTPGVTDFVLKQLEAFKANATFFCVGSQVDKFPVLFEQILDAGHQIGNHTQNHLNGWKTKKELYLRDIELFDEQYRTGLFRPPYGRISKSQKKHLMDRKIIMWSHMAGDFDQKADVTRSVTHLKKAKPGSILVFHDSEKAAENLRFILPKILEHFSYQGYRFKTFNDYAIN